MIMLCYMVQLTPGMGDYPGGPDWMTWAPKSRELSPTGGREETGKIHSMRRTQCPTAGSEMDGATQGGMQGDL